MISWKLIFGLLSIYLTFSYPELKPQHIDVDGKYFWIKQWFRFSLIYFINLSTYRVIVTLLLIVSIFFRIHYALLNLAGFNHNASMLDCVKDQRVQESARKKNLNIFWKGVPGCKTVLPIPVIDLERAIAFYTPVFGHQLERVDVYGNEMAMFPASDEASGMTGALAKGESCCRAFWAIRHTSVWAGGGWRSRSAVEAGRIRRSSRLSGLPR